MSATGIYGLSGSGIDVDSMVKVGMMSKQSEYDRMYKKEVKQEWMKDKYATTYSDLSTFANTTMSNYKMSATLNPQNVTSSKDYVATAVANADAASMTHTLEVKQLSSNAYLITGNNGNMDENVADGLTRVTSGRGINLSDIVSFSGDSFSLKVGDGTDSKTLEYTADQFNSKTLNEFASDINNLGLGIKASYDSTNDSFSFYATTGGSANGIELTANDDNSLALLQNLNLHKVNTTSDASGNVSSTLETAELDYTQGTATSTYGESAKVVIDGKTYTSDTNKLAVSNVTYTFASVGSTTMSVSQDTDKLVENVKKFVEEYNAMLDKLTDMYNEESYKDYDVLTESQKKGMTEEQIQKWEEKAKSGLFYHNQTIGKLISNMREAIYTPVEAVDTVLKNPTTGREYSYNTLMSIGISSSNDRGHLKLDEDKLQKALAADPDCVQQLLGASGQKTRTVNGVEESYTDYGSQGVANRLYDTVLETNKEIKKYAGTSSETADGSSLGNLIQDLKQKMSDFKTMMDAFEKSLYGKYDAMEIAIQRMGVSLGYITGGQQ